jgi:hypothetical protein
VTPVALTINSAYLGGPMRGYPEYNFPAFHEAARWLRSEGWTIFSPAERDEADPTINSDKDQAGWADHLGLDYFMAFDLKAVCEHDAVILLPGWEKSQGARLEAMVAVEVDHPVFEIVKNVIRLRGRRQLMHVEPSRIAAEFIAGTKAYDSLPVVKPFTEDALADYRVGVAR